MAVTRIKNNQITDATVNAAAKLVDYSVSSAKLANNLVYTSDLTVTGNLTVQGNTTTIDTTYTVIEDPVILLAANQVGAPSVDIGFIGQRGTSNNVAFVWDESSTEFVTAYTTTGETNTTIAIVNYADLHTANANIGGNLSVGGNVSITGNIIGSVTFSGNLSAGNLLTNGQVSAAGNVTGGNVLTAGLVSATANIAGGNLTTAGQVVATGNVSGGNVTTAGQVDATGNVNGGNINTAGQISSTGNITSAANISGGNISTSGTFSAASLSASGNVTGGNVISNGIVTSTGNIVTTANVNGGNINSTSAVTAATVAASQTVSATGNVTGGNIITSGLVTATGNINGGNINAATGVRAATGYFTGNVDVLGNLNASVGIVYANSGIFYGDAVTGNGAAYAGVPGFTPLGSNVVMQFGGNVNSYSQLNFQNINNGTSASTDFIATADNGTDTTYYLDMGINSSTFNDPIDYPGFGPNDSYVHNHGGNLLLNPESAGALIKFMVGGTANADVVGTFSNTQLSVTGAISATGNITGGNISTAGAFGAASLSASGNVTGGNINTAGQVIATANVSGGNLTTAGQVSATGNITSAANIAGGNLTIATAINTGTLSTTGNAVIAGNLFVLGNITYNNVDDLRIQDPVIILGTGPNGAPLTSPDSYDRGLFMEYYTSGLGNAWMGWQNSSGNMIAAANVSFSGNDIIGINSYGTFQAGNIYAESAITVGNITGGNLNTAGQVSATGNITGGNISTAGTFGAASLSASGNVTGGNVISNGIVTSTGNVIAPWFVGNVSATTVAATANIAGGNLTTAGQVVATGNVSGGNVNTAGQVVATANIVGGNLTTAGLISASGNVYTPRVVNGATGMYMDAGFPGYIQFFNSNGIQVTFDDVGNISATGNVTGANITTGGAVFATGNVNGSGAVFAGNVTAQNFIGNISGNIDAGGANTQVQFNDNEILNGSAGFTFDKTSNAVGVTGNITGGNILTGGLVSSTGNITSAANIAGGNIISTALVQGATVSATGNVIGGNLTTAGQVTATANITGGNVLTGGAVSATGNITGGNVIATSIKGGNIVISGDNITDTNGRVNFNTAGDDVDFAVNGDTVANIFYVDAGTGTASFGSATQTTNAVVAFNATNSILFPVGNTLQRPGTGVVGMLRFNSISDTLEQYTTTGWESVGTPAFTVIGDEQFNGDGVTTDFTLATVNTTNGVIVSINGVLQIPTSAYSVSTVGSVSTLEFTEAPLTGDLIDVRALTTTTSVDSISNQSANAVVATSASSAVVNITGDLLPVANNTQSLGSSTQRWSNLFVSGSTITMGNVVMKNVAGGNTIAFYGPDGTTPATIASTSVDTTTIANGTSNVSVVGSGANIRMNVGGTSNVAVVYSGGMAITGDLSVTGNATLSGNILGDRVQNGTTSIDIQTAGGNANITVGGTSNVVVWSTTGEYITGTLNVSGNIVSTGANGVANIGSTTTYFNTVHAKATSAQYADLAENYAADAGYEPGTVLSFGGEQEVTLTVNANDPRIAGVVSTNPSYIMNSTLDSEHVATLALTGRVPTKVTGPVAKGDMMIAAGNGRAQACATPTIGTVIGKALENHAGGEGIIEVVVGRL